MAGIKGTKGNPGHFELTYLNLRSGKVTKLTLPREGGSKNRRFQFSMSTGSVTDWATGEIVVRWGKPFLGSSYFPSLYDTVTTLVNRRPTLFLFHASSSLKSLYLVITYLRTDGEVLTISGQGMKIPFILWHCLSPSPLCTFWCSPGRRRWRRPPKCK